MKHQLVQAHRHKPRPINLNLTTPETLTISDPNVNMDNNSLQRYRRSSLPNSIGHSLGQSINIRKSVEQQPTTDIYFNANKKSKFMKEIVDNYFEDTLQKIYGNQREMEGRERLMMTRNFQGVAKRNKIMFASIGDSGQSRKEHQRQKEKQREKSKQRSKQKQLNADRQHKHHHHPQLDPQQQDLEGELHQNLNISSNTTNTTVSFLPPIYQSHQDIDVGDMSRIFPEMAQSSSQMALKTENNMQKILTFQNEAFKIFMVLQNGQPRYRVKQFKPSGMEILKRQQRALKFGVERIWKQSQINANSFVSDLVHPLKNLICKIMPHHDAVIKYKIRSTPYRNHLLANEGLQLKNFLREMCAILKKIQGRVLNNKINPSNIFLLKGNRACIGQWGYSSFRDKYQIQDNKFQSRLNPILKSSKQWLATPQYLSPELLQAILAKSDEQQPDIWEQKSSSDIWSLGVTLLQILTMIPIWMHEVCNAKLKTKKPVIRTGLLGTDDRKLAKIYEKQKKLQKMVAQCLESEIEEGVGRDLIELVSRMIVHDARDRISLDEIITMLK